MNRLLCFIFDCGQEAHTGKNYLSLSLVSSSKADAVKSFCLLLQEIADLTAKTLRLMLEILLENYDDLGKDFLCSNAKTPQSPIVTDTGRRRKVCISKHVPSLRCGFQLVFEFSHS